MKQKKSTLYVVQAAVIAALYVALTYAQEFLWPGSASAAIQFRVSEMLTMLALFTPAAVPGLTVGCVLANLLNAGVLPVDILVGSFATLLAALAMRKCRNIRFKNIPFFSALMPAVFNGVLVGWEIEVFFIDGPFHFGSYLLQAGTVALGELGVLFILGLPFAILLEKRGLAKRLFPNC